MDRVEEHLFACGDCSARLQQMAALGAGLATLVRQGRVSGIVSRAILNRLQRDGVHVRMFSLLPGETVPCAVFPGDDLIVTSLRADFSGVDAVTLSVTGPGDSPFSRYDDVPVSGPGGEVLWATPCGTRASDAIDAVAAHADVQPAPPAPNSATTCSNTRRLGPRASKGLYQTYLPVV